MKDNCNSTLPTPKPRLELPEHRWFLGYERYSACFQDALSWLVEVYPKRVLSPDSDTAGSRKPFEENRLIVREMAALASTRKVDIWSVQPELSAVQAFPVDATHFLGNV